MLVLCILLALSQVCHVGNALAFEGRGGLSTSQSDKNNNNLVPRSENGFQSRKNFLGNAASMLLLPASTILFPDIASAAAPITTKETDSVGVMARKAFRPKPPKLLRRKLSQDFAVLLMRSSYNALDLLDCVAMDQFQRDFFLIRGSDYEPYVKALGPGMVQQGDLTDPYYFDFISFAQYQTVNREITQDPPFIFEEQQPVDQGEDKPQKFVPVVVKRDPQLTNAMLASEHSRMVGVVVLDHLEEVFGETDSAIPKIERNSKPDSAKLLSSLQQLVNLFLINGYAFGGSVSIDSENMGLPGATGTKFLISLNGPATLWGGKILQQEGAKLSNNFVEKVATELIHRAGYASSSSIKYDGTSEEMLIRII